MAVIHRQVYQYFGFNPTGDLGPFTFYTKKNWNKVFYLKAPPTSPPTDWQLHQMELWRYFAETWNGLPVLERIKWSAAAKIARLRISGYNLFFWYAFRRDVRTLATIERQSGITLEKPWDA